MQNQDFKKQCIIIPLQTELNDHQLQNAQAMAEMHPDYFSVILQQDCADHLRAAVLGKLTGF